MGDLMERLERKMTKDEFIEHVYNSEGWFHILIESEDEDGAKTIGIHEFYGHGCLGWTENPVRLDFWSKESLLKITKELHLMGQDDLVFTEDELEEYCKKHPKKEMDEEDDEEILKHIYK